MNAQNNYLILGKNPGMARYESARHHIVERLRSGLSENYHYHNIHHILDVADAVEMLCDHEKVSDHDREMLRIAALYHDSGFLESPVNHENHSCDIALRELPAFGYSEEEINTICEIIMATRVPQRPMNHLQQIICDADLDYLGRDDFFPIANKVYQEMKLDGKVKDENDWNQLQISFLSAHNYFTPTAIMLRAPVKAKHLEQVKKMAGKK